jgi:hypothetical protein
MFPTRASESPVNLAVDSESAVNLAVDSESALTSAVDSESAVYAARRGTARAARPAYAGQWGLIGSGGIRC